LAFSLNRGTEKSLDEKDLGLIEDMDKIMWGDNNNDN